MTTFSMQGASASISRVQGSAVMCTGLWLGTVGTLALDFLLRVFGVSFILFFLSFPKMRCHSDNTMYGFVFATSDREEEAAFRTYRCRVMLFHLNLLLTRFSPLRHAEERRPGGM